MSFIANNMTTPKDKDELLKTFELLDLDGNGILSEQELIQGTPAKKSTSNSRNRLS